MTPVGRQIEMIFEKLDRIDRRLGRLLNQADNLENIMSAAMDRLRAEITENTTVTQGAIALLQDLNARLKAAIADEDVEAITQLSEELDRNTAALASALVANTPVAGEPSPVLTPTEPQAEETPKGDAPAEESTAEPKP